MRVPHFSVNDFRATAKDPGPWRAKALELRNAADALWSSFVRELHPGGGGHLPEEARRDVICRYMERVYVSHFLYGFSLECALKYRLVKANPESVALKTRHEGGLEMVSIGTVQLGKDGHNLVKLAKAVDNLAGSAQRLCDSSVHGEILDYLSECIQWQGRYPVPRRVEPVQPTRRESPPQVFGLHLRDWIDPMLDDLTKE